MSQRFRLQLSGLSNQFLQVRDTRDRVLMKKVKLVKACALGDLH